MISIQRLCFVFLAAATMILTGCDRNPKEWKTPNMTNLTPRLKPLFEHTKTVCFGRFVVDVPESATVAWGEISVPLGVSIYPNGVDQVKEMAQKFIVELKDKKAVYHNHVPLLISEDDVAQPQGKIITGYEDFVAVNDLKINGYFKLDNDGVVIDARPLMDNKDETIEEINSIARRLRPRAGNEIPTEPGNCIEHAFLPDKPGTDNKAAAELIGIGFRLKEYPDTHLSIFINPSNPHYSNSDSLEWQLDRLEKDLKAEDPNHPQLKTRYLRRGARQIHTWLNGFEVLTHTPEQPEAHAIHDFAMDFRGVPSDPLKPHADIRMQTGVADNLAGATKASLTDDEAIAVWDKITSTIRVRPTTEAPLKTSEADPQPRSPLGELAATGRVCPQTGWWQASESENIEGRGRQHLKAGERMPHLISFGEPSLWQKLKGERPSFRMATVWKLVDYDGVPSPADGAAPVVVQASAANGDAAGGTTEGYLNEEPSPREKG